MDCSSNNTIEYRTPFIMLLLYEKNVLGFPSLSSMPQEQSFLIQISLALTLSPFSLVLVTVPPPMHTYTVLFYFLKSFFFFFLHIGVWEAVLSSSQCCVLKLEAQRKCVVAFWQRRWAPLVSIL